MDLQAPKLSNLLTYSAKQTAMVYDEVSSYPRPTTMPTQSCPTPAPADHSPTAALQEAPIQALTSNHRRTLAQCAALHALAQTLLMHGSNASTQSAAQDILHYFDTTARDCQADEEQDLFPALIESMAGSDAVCLRGMTEGLSDMLRALDRRWRHQLRAPLLRIAKGESAELPSADLQAFSEEYAAYAERCDTELLPMAERLLTDPEIALLGQAMRARRGL